MNETSKCRYMQAAYPTLDADDTCSEHRHDEQTFALARAMATAFQQPDPTDEQVGWCMDDAAAVVDDFDPTPDAWVVTQPEVTDEVGLDFTLSVNGVPYVVQPSEWEPSHPVSRAQWEAWEDEDCDHDWIIRPESDTRVCEFCGTVR
jgi:hypothetical protein